MGARADRADDLVGLGGGEDELHVRRGLLDDLEQGVEARRGDHVGLVDDVDLVARVDGREVDALAQVAGVVDTAVRGGVDLDDVDAARAPGGEVAAAAAATAGRRRGPLLAVEAAGQDAGARGLAAAARAAEQIGVADPAVGDGAHERLGDVLLADHLVEGVGAVAAVEGELGVRRLLLDAGLDGGLRVGGRGEGGGGDLGVGALVDGRVRLLPVVGLPEGGVVGVEALVGGLALLVGASLGAGRRLDGRGGRGRLVVAEETRAGLHEETVIDGVDGLDVLCWIAHGNQGISPRRRFGPRLRQARDERPGPAPPAPRPVRGGTSRRLPPGAATPRSPRGRRGRPSRRRRTSG
ncbi:hypothetical protein PRAC110570_12385 [Propionibacterium acidifaciens]